MTTPLKLLDILCTLPIHNFGPKFAAIRQYYHKLASTPNIEYSIMRLVRGLGGDTRSMSDLTGGLVVLFSTCQSAAVTCTFKLVNWIVGGEKSLSNMKTLLEFPVDWFMSTTSNYQKYFTLMLLSFMPTPTYYFGTREGQAELIVSIVAQVAPLMLVMGDICGQKGSIEAVSFKLANILSDAGADRPIVQVYLPQRINFNPWNDHVDLMCLSLFLASVLWLCMVYYWSKSTVRR